MPKKLTYEEVKNYIELQGYQLLSEKYINNHTKLKMICDKGHECEITFGNFKQGKRCRTCAFEKISQDRKLNYDYVKEYIELQGYTLLENKYVKSDIPMKMKCNNGHICYISWDNFKYGRRCKECKYEGLSEKFRYSYDYVNNYIQSYGYKLLSKEYINNSTPLLIECTNGHKFYRTFGNFKLTQKCPICSQSEGENKISEILMKLNKEFIYNKPYFNDLLSPKGNPLRPDFILPNEKIWIEYDGIFHHEKVYENDGHDDIVINDKIKNKYAKKHSWNLIRIPYWEFDNIETILNKELKIINK